MSRAEAVRLEEAHASREKGESPLTRADYRPLRYWTRSLLLLVNEIAPPARQVGVNHGAALGEQPTDAVLPAPGEPAVRQIRLACQGVALSMEECLG